MTVKVAQAGVDTWRLAWYVDETTSTAKALDGLADRPSKRGMQIGAKVADHTVGWIKGNRMCWAEGHPASSEGALGDGDDLDASCQRVIDGLADHGIDIRAGTPRWWVGTRATESNFGPLPGYPSIRRLDITCDLDFQKGHEGLATLAGVAALPLAGVKKVPWYEAGGSRLETVVFKGRGGRNTLGRWYDKSYERSGRDRDRGLVIRPEDQRRYSRETAKGVHEVTNATLRTAFHRRFQTLWTATRGIKVGTPDALAAKIIELRESGELTHLQAEKLAGHLLLSRVDDCASSRATYFRRRSEARRHGLVLADGVLEEVEIDLGDILEEAFETEAWGCG